MKWKKLGRVFSPEAKENWMQTHASYPVARRLSGDVFRIYFSTRDSEQRSSITYLDINLNRPTELLNHGFTPIIQPGDRGLFDDSGVSLGCVVENSDETRIYYVGWNLSVTVPWRNSIGLATSPSSTETYRKISKAPVLDRSAEDPYSLSYPWVHKEGGLWRMWYGSNLSWGDTGSEMLHAVKYAESADGIHWRRTGEVCVGLKMEEEVAVSRPCVTLENDGYRMWYSYRLKKNGSAYRIGYAESKDGVHWVRKDTESGISVSSDGWDSDSACYPSVFSHGDRKYMLYNGNGYGVTGFGLAVLE